MGERHSFLLREPKVKKKVKFLSVAKIQLGLPVENYTEMSCLRDGMWCEAEVEHITLPYPA